MAQRFAEASGRADRCATAVGVGSVRGRDGPPARPPARRARPVPAAVALLIVVAIVGCSAFPAAGTVPDEELGGAIPPPRGVRDTRVVRVVDGDTVVLRRLGSSRLIGVDTPEVYGGRQCYGREASAFARRVLAPASRVRYAPGAEPRDRYGRRLVYLWLADGRSFNAMLVEGGYARTLTIPPNDRYASRLRRLARTARHRGWGQWSRAGCAGR